MTENKRGLSDDAGELIDDFVEWVIKKYVLGGECE